jgi:hypothetical protein
MPIEELKAELQEQPQPPADADPNSAGAIVAHIDHVITQANTIKKLLYGGAAASVIQRDIAALLAQMDRDLHTARKANNRLAAGALHPPSWSRNEQ